MRFTSPTGVVVLDADLVALPGPPRIELGAGPGGYGLAVGHVGRTEVQDAARRVSEETSRASAGGDQGGVAFSRRHRAVSDPPVATG
ncbi:hypothetical protein [Micromonospora sp. NPDC048830]|uniref:hypothetical protein n=1 Tax=Micromonospora sp. NPDC048830 TaxID=3364257 RepID=UPI00371573EF